MSNATDRSFIRAYNPKAEENETMKPRVTPWTAQSTGTVDVSKATGQVVVGQGSVAQAAASEAVGLAETDLSLPEQVAAVNWAATRVIPKSVPTISGKRVPPKAPIAPSTPPPTIVRWTDPPHNVQVAAEQPVAPQAAVSHPAAEPFTANQPMAAHSTAPQAVVRTTSPALSSQTAPDPNAAAPPNTDQSTSSFQTTGQPTTGTTAASSFGGRHYRTEAAHAAPTPHLLRTQHANPARQTNQFAVATEESAGVPRPVERIRPQWEVDQFRWPVVCNVLQDTSSHRLNDVIESMVEQAKLGNKVVGVTSFDRKEGRSTIAMSLARLAAKAKVDVALIDGDLDEPSIAGYLGVSFDTSWNHIDSRLPLGEAAIVSIKDQFVVFPAGHDTAFPERTVRNTAGPLLANLCESFDIIFVDIGPIFTAAHRWLMPEIGNQIRNALVVRDVRRTSVEQVDDACCRLVKAGVQNMAIIDNFLGVDG